jgi:small GTP-binding protein
MTPDFAFDVFLSYHSEDRPRVRRLAERLRDAGVRVWFDEWITRPEDDIYLSVEHGLEASRTLVLCLSQAALGSNWVAMERSTVLFRDPSNVGRRFIPLLLSDCGLPDTLRRYRYVDFRQESDVSFQELVAASGSAAEANAAPREIPGNPLVPPLRSLPSNSRAKTRAGKPEPKATPERQLSDVTFDRKLPGRGSWIRTLAISPDGEILASGSGETIKIWNLETGECLTTLSGHTANIDCVTISVDGNLVISGGRDDSLRVWDWKESRLVLTKELDDCWPQEVVPLRDGTTLLFGGLLGATGTTNLAQLDIRSGDLAWELNNQEGVLSVAVGPDEAHALTGSQQGNLRLWDIQTGKCVFILNGHSSSVGSVKIAPDGRHAASGSQDNTVKIWDLEAGICLGTLEGHESEVDSVAFSPGGELLASTGFMDRTVRIWDWRAGTCIQTVEIEASPVSVAFDTGGTRLVVGAANSVIYVYRLDGARVIQPMEQTRRYVNAKVVLVGESGVGKSGLAHRLIDDRFVQTHSTHGMQVWRLDLPLEPAAGLECEALLWDLAGQEDYRLIHQLFLDETALALLLFDPQEHDPFAEVGAWLKVLRNTVSTDHARQVAQILVAARIDRGNVKVSQKKIDRFLEAHGLAAYLTTSAMRGDNCSDAQAGGTASALKELIARHIPWDRLPWTSTPRLLSELKNAIVAMTEQKNVRLLRFAELTQRLEQALPQEKFDEADVRTAVKLLANHGLVLPLKFGDLVLLRPELLNGYASAVIRAARDHTDEIGCVKEQAVFDRTIDLEGVERLESADEELLMRAMAQTFLDKSLCIAEDTPEGRHLVFPSQYRQERSIPSHPEIFVSYTFSGEWQTVYTTLVVRLWYSREFQHRELWRNAAEFATSKGRTVGLLMERSGDGEGKVSVFFETGVPDELKVVFIEYVHRHLEKYARDVRRDRRYVCQNDSCGKPVTDLTAVRARLDAKKDFIYCQHCDARVPLIDHIEQRLASDPVAQIVLGMDQRATQELDTQALEQILTGHMMAICGEANQIFRELTKFDYGIDGEVEFKDNDGAASGRKIYVQLKSGNSYLRTRKADGKEVFDVKKLRHLKYWISQPVDVYLVIRQQDEVTGQEAIRWMNVTRYLNERPDKESRQIVFEGEKLDAPAVWRVRDQFFR